MSVDPFAPLASADGGNARSASKRLPVMPLPADAPAPPSAHPQLGTPSGRWTYRDAAGDGLGFVCRFETAEGKQFRPLVLFRDATGVIAWRWESWPAPRPLYGLDRLAGRPSAPVVVCEGEKAADAASTLLPDHVVIASPNGSKSASKADWAPLAGRYVTIWPDADAAGNDYASAVCKAAASAGALAIKIIPAPADIAEGWDAADAVSSGWGETEARAFIATAVAVKGPAIGKRERGPPQRDSLITLTERFELWHDADGEAYVTLPVKGHHESWPIRSARIKSLLSGRFYEETGATIGGQALEDVLRVLEARSFNDGAELVPCRRVGRHGDAVYIDLCDEAWRAVEVRADGWAVIDAPPAKLMRAHAMRSLPEPEAGCEIAVLRRFANLSDDDFVLVVLWLVAALWPSGPYPILILSGEQGSGKSLFTRLIRSLIDPSAAPIRSAPRDDRDLLVQAYNAHIIALDNLSSMPALLADGLCRLATGGGFSTRKLHTDNEEAVFEAQRPIILNGISLLSERADLAERALTIHLRTIPDTARMPEDELFREFELVRPQIIGALLDGVASAIRNLPTTRLDRSPRMADFAKLAVAAAPGLGFDADAFIQAYETNRRDVTEATFEADPVAVAVRNFVTTAHPAGWTGTATDLLAALNALVPEGLRKSKAWPFTAQGLGNRIDRIAPLLRQKGFAVEKRRSGARTITIAPMGGPGGAQTAAANAPPYAAGGDVVLPL